MSITRTRKNKTTDLKKAFIREYIKNLDPEKAAIRAGYPESKGKTLLENPAIVAEIKKAIRESIDRLKIEKSYIIDKLVKIVEFSLEIVEILDKSGNPTGRQEFRDAGIGFKALEILAKHTGLNDNRDAEKQDSPDIRTISNLDEERI